ncbi:phosphatase PAP2 family protein [Hymenobacter negativus]|uniref:Phosphatase PAP2 family protein n=1 Tax=Hymenobacter negativus TaxID=2795026 RepID=A0ABS3QLQ3_9BACT|nr:phosphatase PAP2 family protein [Hymenobacter negativus]MBO2012194.1 phosphatase PAP2 family protein [Hymenobacter negativus]
MTAPHGGGQFSRLLLHPYSRLLFLMRVPPSLRWLFQLTLSAALLCPVAFWWLDYPLAHWSVQHLSGWRNALAAITATFDSVLLGPLFYLHGLVALVVLFLGARLLTRRPFFTLLLAIVVLRVSSEVAANILKVLIHRPRPGDNANFPDSFPSGHTTIYFGTFLLFAACFPKYRGLLLGVPVLIGIERVINNWHYLSDVLAGVALASLLTSFFLSLAYSWTGPCGEQVPRF